MTGTRWPGGKLDGGKAVYLDIVKGAPLPI